MSSPQIDIWLNGSTGKMGVNLKKVINALDKHYTLLGESSGSLAYPDKCVWDEKTVVIDFSSVRGTESLLRYIEKQKNKNYSVLIATTGLSKDVRNKLKKAAKEKSLKILFAPNTSIGILSLMKATSVVAEVLSENNFDIEIIETHHRHKVDAPSGTALLLANNLQEKLSSYKVRTERTKAREDNEIGVHSVRGGGVFGEHEVRFISEDEEISFKHRAFSRDLFSKGALNLAKRLSSKPPGIYSLLEI